MYVRKEQGWTAKILRNHILWRCKTIKKTIDTVNDASEEEGQYHEYPTKICKKK